MHSDFCDGEFNTEIKIDRRIKFITLKVFAAVLRTIPEVNIALNQEIFKHLPAKAAINLDGQHAPRLIIIGQALY